MRQVQLLSFIGALSAIFLIPAYAADLGPAQTYGVETPQVLGTGWYLRGDVGYVDNNLPTMNYGAVPFTNEEFSKGWEGGLGAGYQFNPWLRADLTIDRSIQNPVQGSLHLNDNPVFTGPAACQSPGATTMGCDVNLRGGKFDSTRVMLNGYIDLGTWSGLTPYVGGGIGISRNQLQAMSGDEIDTASKLTPTPIDYGTFSTKTGARMSFAWALMGGVAIDVAPHVKLDIGYRYIDIGTGTSGKIDGLTPVVSVGTQRDNEVRVGVRYTPD